MKRFLSAAIIMAAFLFFLVHTVPALADTVGPTVTASSTDYEWKRSNFSVSLAATADSGVASYQYVVTKSNAQPTTGWINGTTATISAEGDNYLWYKVSDMSGNTAIGFFGPYKLDKTIPSASTSLQRLDDRTFRITVTGTDTLSGVKQITMPNSTVVTASSATYDVTATGTYSFTVADNAGNTTTVSQKVDLTPPFITIHDPWSQWAASGNGTFKPLDDSGISSLEYQFTATTSLPTSGWKSAYYNPDVFTTVTVEGQGLVYLWVRATDKMGNVGVALKGPWKIDGNSPSVTYTVANDNGSCKLINVIATDDLSGVAYIVDPSGTTNYRSSVSYKVCSAGTYRFSIKDQAYNETVVNVRVDFTSPTVTSSVSQTAMNADFPVTLTATAPSGILNFDYVLSQSPAMPTEGWTPVVGPIMVSGEGRYYLWYRVTDKSGNTKTDFFSYQIDKTAPTATFSALFENGAVRVYVMAEDTGSGVKSITLPDSSTVMTATASYMLTTGNGNFVVTDHAGNTLTITPLMLATEAVSQLESLGTKATDAEVNAVNSMVNTLPDGPEKTALASRADAAYQAAHAGTAAANAVTDAEEAVQQLTTLAQIDAASSRYAQAQGLVDTLSDGPLKNSLVERLAVVKQAIDQANAAAGQAKAEAEATMARATQTAMSNTASYEDAVVALNEAQAKIDQVADPQQKAALQQQLAPIQAVVSAQGSVMMAGNTVNELVSDESKVTAASVADGHAQVNNAKAMVQSLPPSEKKTQLTNTVTAMEQNIKVIDAVLKVLEAETLASSVQPSQAAIDGLTAKYNEASALVQKLPTGESRDQLQTRLAAVQLKIYEMIAIMRTAEAEAKVAAINMVWINTDMAQTAINAATTAVAKLPAEQLRADLEARLATAQATVRSVRAKIKVSIAEGMVIQSDINSAWTYVNALPTGDERTDYGVRLTAVQAVADATILVSKAESDLGVLVSTLISTQLTSYSNLNTIEALYQTALNDASIASERVASLGVSTVSTISSRISDLKGRVNTLNRDLPTYSQILGEAQGNLAAGNGYQVPYVRVTYGSNVNLSTTFSNVLASRLGGTTNLTWTTSHTSMILLKAGVATSIRTGVAKVTVSSGSASVNLYVIMTNTR